jgi:hypothetical protein
MFGLLVVAALHTTGINLHVGDLSATLGYVDGDSERDRIRGHLLFARDLLAAADTSGLSPTLRAARARNLDVLARYARAGQFPRNDDHPDARRPTFVDERGEICAVGALFASERGYPAAVRVAAHYKYAFIDELDDPELLAWQKTSGLSREELAIIQPGYDHGPSVSDRMWLPWGLSDRSQFGAIRLSLSQEVSTVDSFDTLWMTMHAQTPLPGGRSRSFYLTMPMGVVIDEHTTDIAAAGMPLGEAPRRWFGNGDVGVYFGKEYWTGPATVFRLGALLPTATERMAQPPSMRAGDLVMELPRAYGGRFAVSRLSGWRHVVDRTRYAYRLDAGFDYARAADGENTTVVPRAAIGALISRPYATLSIDTAIAHAYDTASGDVGLRWSTGTTIRLADRKGRGCGFEPAFTVAAVRTPEGWGGAFSLELGFGFPTSTPGDD